MNTETQILVQEWLIKSERDLVAAKILAEHNPPIYDYAAFHCQQSAEKAIKAFLVSMEEKIPKGPNGHNMAKLIKLAVKYKEKVDSRIEYRDDLTKKAVDPRYPDYGLGNIADFKDAFRNAESFLEYIKSILPPEVHPQKP